MFSSRHPTGHESRKFRTSTSLLSAAEDLFGEVDYRDVTVERIATRAGVSVGSVYVHFGSKEGLYLRVVEDALRRSDDYTGNRVWSDSPLQRIFNTGEAYVNFALDHPGAFRLIAARSVQASEVPEIAEIQSRISDRLTGEMARLSSEIQAAIDAGELAPLSVRHVLTYLWASWSGVIAMSVRDDEFRISSEDARVILDGAREVLARGMVSTMTPPDACVGGPSTHTPSAKAA